MIFIFLDGHPPASQPALSRLSSRFAIHIPSLVNLTSHQTGKVPVGQVVSRDTASVPLSSNYDFSMASKRKSASISRVPNGDDADDVYFELSVTVRVGRLQTSKKLKTSPSTPEDATADHRDDEEFAKRSTNPGPTSPVTVSLTEHTSDHKTGKAHKQGTIRLLELPLDVLCLVADHLDIVSRACLGYAHPALGCFSKDPRNLSACAKSRLLSLVQRDGISVPKELLGAATQGTNEGQCSEYQVARKYCTICRCEGHLSHCPGCRVRTCAREDVEFWRKWTGIMDYDAALLTDAMHSSP